MLCPSSRPILPGKQPRNVWEGEEPARSAPLTGLGCCRAPALPSLAVSTVSELPILQIPGLSAPKPSLRVWVSPWTPRAPCRSAPAPSCHPGVLGLFRAILWAPCAFGVAQPCTNAALCLCLEGLCWALPPGGSSVLKLRLFLSRRWLLPLGAHLGLPHFPSQPFGETKSLGLRHQRI